MRGLDTTIETWKAILGYEGLYEVSDLGRVRSLRRPGLILRPAINPRGYAHVGLSRDTKGTTFNVHRLVSEAFLGPCPAGYETNHINGVKADNRAANLEWATRSANIGHAFATGLHRPTPVKGSHNGRAKLTESDACRIRSLAGRVRRKDMAEQCGVSLSTIDHILQGRVWKDLP
jgi:hypothetical protein